MPYVVNGEILNNRSQFPTSSLKHMILNISELGNIFNLVNVTHVFVISIEEIFKMGQILSQLVNSV